MDSLPTELLALLREGLATLAAGGRVEPHNEAMRELLAAAGGPRGSARDLAGLGLAKAQQAELRAGGCLAVQFGARHWQLRCAGAGASAWLVASETTAEQRAGAALAELVRLRGLAAAAGNLVHDFNNLLNSCIGLAGHVRPHMHDPLDQRILRELEHGTQQGAQLARAMARLLVRSSGERATVPSTALVDDALALSAKAAGQRGVQLAVERSASAPVVRTVVAEAVQALWHGLMALVDRQPRALRIVLDAAEVAIGEGRVRSCARLCITSSGLDAEARDELLGLVKGAPGLIAALGRSPLAPGLAAAVFVQGRLGGELRAEAVGEDLLLEYRWPAAS
jgi:signal transduction histidine kinase